MSQVYAYDEDAPSVAEEWELEALLHSGLHDRRSMARAYRSWTGMLRGRACPSLEGLEPAGVAGPGDILIDFRRNGEDPELTCIGGALLAECGARGLKRLSQAPKGSFLALLAAHCRSAVVAGRALVLEGERAESDGRYTSYRAILLPFSSDGEEVDFVQGRISWRGLAGRDLSEQIREELEREHPCSPVACTTPIWPQVAALELPAVN